MVNKVGACLISREESTDRAVEKRKLLAKDFDLRIRNNYAETHTPNNITMDHNTPRVRAIAPHHHSTSSQHKCPG